MDSQEAGWLLNEKHRGEKTAAFFEDLERLEAGEPLAYIIGSIPFLNTQVLLDSHPLIPRTETEFWVEKALQEIKTTAKSFPPGRTIKVLDLCAGSGCIGVAVLKALPDAQVDFVEIDHLHHSTVNRTIRLNGLDKTKFRLFGGSLFETVSDKYDFILTNPPYVDPLLNRVSESVKKFEPDKALYGGDNGLNLIRSIIEQSSIHLESAGILYLEHEPEQTETIKRLATDKRFAIKTYKDQYGTERYSRLEAEKS